MMNKKIYAVIFVCVANVMMLSACKSGGGGSSSGTSTEPITSSTSRTFTVALKSVDVRRVSNGDAVVVDTAGINSGTLNLKNVN